MTISDVAANPRPLRPSFGGGAEVGIIIPASIALSVIGISAQLTVGERFIAGITPSFMVLLIHIWARIGKFGTNDMLDRPALGSSFRSACPIWEGNQASRQLDVGLSPLREHGASDRSHVH